jgi:hypothetical protein
LTGGECSQATTRII